MSKGKRQDILAFRDKLVAGATDLELAMDDSTCRSSATFTRFTIMLRAAMREERARVALEAEMADVTLRPWQMKIVEVVDEYAPTKTSLVWLPGDLVVPSCFEEFGSFRTHSYP